MVYFRILFFLFFCSLQGLVFGIGGGDGEISPFTGTLLSYSAESIAPNEAYIQITSLVTRLNGAYNRFGEAVDAPNIHTVPVFATIQKGLVKNIDFQLSFQANYAALNESSKIFFDDIFFFLGWQLLEASKNRYEINFRTLIGESFPTGHYNNLVPELAGMDVSGTGSFSTLLILSMNRLFCKKTPHPLESTLNFYFVFPSAVKVSNANLYGGGPGTRGTVLVGKSFITNVAVEYALSSRFSFCMDTNFTYQAPSLFIPSPDNRGPKAGTPYSYVVSITPGIEYSKNEHLGMLGGAWVTVAGRNFVSFVSYYFSIYKYF